MVPTEHSRLSLEEVKAALEEQGLPTALLCRMILEDGQAALGEKRHTLVWRVTDYMAVNDGGDGCADVKDEGDVDSERRGESEAAFIDQYASIDNSYLGAAEMDSFEEEPEQLQERPAMTDGMPPVANFTDVALSGAGVLWNDFASHVDHGNRGDFAELGPRIDRGLNSQDGVLRVSPPRQRSRSPAGGRLGGAFVSLDGAARRGQTNMEDAEDFLIGSLPRLDDAFTGFRLHETLSLLDSTLALESVSSSLMDDIENKLSAAIELIEGQRAWM